MSGKVFLIDSNALITPSKQYYPFDFARPFWEQMENHITVGNIAILDLVKNEILKGNTGDDLDVWFRKLTFGNYIKKDQEPIWLEYGKIIEYIKNNPCYNKNALDEWSDHIVADPWLIAVAKVYGYVLVTFEKPNGNLNQNSPCKNVKIPDVAHHFGVETTNLFAMMRSLGFHF